MVRAKKGAQYTAKTGGFHGSFVAVERRGLFYPCERKTLVISEGKEIAAVPICWNLWYYRAPEISGRSIAGPPATGVAVFCSEPISAAIEAVRLSARY